MPTQSNTRWLLRCLLLVGICYTAADLTWAGLNWQQASPAQPSHPARAPRILSLNGQPSDPQSLIDLLQHEGTADRAAEPDSGPAAPRPVATPAPSPCGPPPRLTGTMAGGGHRLAVLQQGDETRVVGPGEALGDYRVLDISPFSVLLRARTGQQVTLTMNLAGGSSAPAPTPTPTPPVQPKKAVAPARMTRAQLTQLLDHLSDVSPKLQFEPVRQGDEVVGFQVNFKDPDNPLAQLGLQSQDVVTELNGHPLKGPDDLHQAYQELRTAMELHFQLKRGGQSQQLDYSLEP